MSTPQVYTAINGVMADMASEGIAKGRRNKEQGYDFRGIDDVYAALSRSLVNNKLLMLPRALSHRHDVRLTKSGTNMYVAIVECEFDFVSVEDGTMHTIRTWGEAQDNGDKSTNKAMSAAFKYAAMQAFCIPTEGDNDADAHTPEDTVPQAERLTPENRAKIEGAFNKADTIDKADTGLAHYREKLTAQFHGELLEIYDAAIQRIKAHKIPNQSTPFDEAA